MLELLRRKRTAIVVTTLLAFGAAILTVFQNCAPKNSVAIGIKDDLISPFAEKKVRLDDARFNDESSASKIGKGKTALSEKTDSAQALPITIVVNNACAIPLCKDEKNKDAISCKLLVNRLQKGLADRNQYFTTELPSELKTVAEVEAWISTNDVDLNCMVGLTESRTYKPAATFDDTYYTNQRPALQAAKFEQGLLVKDAEGKVVFAKENLAPVKVAIVDTGVANVADLQGVVELRTNMRGPTTSSSTCLGRAPTNEYPTHPHGTFIAGIIAGVRNNQKGVAGLAPNAKILAYSVGDACSGAAPNAELANAVEMAIKDGAEVINVSYGGLGSDFAMEEALRNAVANNILVTISAGNNSDNNDELPYFPTNYADKYLGVISVGALAPDGNLAAFSNFGQKVKIAAPGQNIYSISGLNPAGPEEYSEGAGTSYAAPMVASAAALVIGNLKNKSVAFDYQFLEKAVTTSGATNVPALAALVRKGAVLDFERLANSLKDFKPGSNTPMQVNFGTLSSTGSGATQVITLPVSWDLPIAHPGARIGIFDTGCGFSQPCAIQSYAMADWKGSQSFQLTRNELVATMANKSDPSFALKLSFAVYYKIEGKNNYGIDAVKTFDLRSIDTATPSSPLLGQVENMRMDMQYLYVRGWSCVQDSNAAMRVQLVDDNGAPIYSDYAYNYTLMVPHSPLDNLYALGTGPAMATGISVIFKSGFSYLAGLEANPTIIADCRTLTAQHGYEFAIPLYRLKGGLAGKGFRILSTSTSTKKGYQQVALASSEGLTRFVFPEADSNPVLTSNFAVTRAADFAFSGKLCSSSGSPVEVEISFTNYNFNTALFNKFTGTQGSYLGGLASTGRYPAASLNKIWQSKSLVNGVPQPMEFHNTVTTELAKIPWETKDDTVVSYFDEINASFEPYRPNISVPCPSSWSRYQANGVEVLTEAQQEAEFEAEINTYGLKQLKTGADLIYKCSKATLNKENVFVQKYVEQNATAHKDTSWKGNGGIFWDLYDAGEGFSNELVGYTFNPAAPVGELLKSTYGVSSVLREVKKYETPMGQQTRVLTVKQLDPGLKDSCPNGFYHTLNTTVIPDIVNFAGNATAVQKGFFLKSQPPGNVAVNQISDAMRKVPVTLRFFQDGRLILHLESDFASNFKAQPYKFHGTSY